jgi:hypothetical protein
MLPTWNIGSFGLAYSHASTSERLTLGSGDPELPSLGITVGPVRLTLRVKLHGRGLRAEADAARRLPHVSRRVCRRRDAVILVS